MLLLDSEGEGGEINFTEDPENINSDDSDLAFELAGKDIDSGCDEDVLTQE